MLCAYFNVMNRACREFFHAHASLSVSGTNLNWLYIVHYLGYAASSNDRKQLEIYWGFTVLDRGE